MRPFASASTTISMMRRNKTSSRMRAARQIASRRWSRSCTTISRIVNGFMSTIHSYTNDQRILDLPTKTCGVPEPRRSTSYHRAPVRRKRSVKYAGVERETERRRLSGPDTGRIGDGFHCDLGEGSDRRFDQRGVQESGERPSYKGVLEYTTSHSFRATSWATRTPAFSTAR